MEILNLTNRSQPLKVCQSILLKTSIFQTRLGFLHFCMKFISCVMSCGKKFATWVGASLGSVYAEKWFADNSWDVTVSLVSNDSMTKHYWWTTSKTLWNIWEQTFLIFYDWNVFFLAELCRQIMIRLGNVHPSLKYQRLWKWKHQLFAAKPLILKKTSLLLYKRKEDSNDCSLPRSHTSSMLE